MMKKFTIEQETSRKGKLSGGFYVISRKCQNSIQTNDEVVVTVLMLLPTIPSVIGSKILLIPKLQFRDRVTVFGEYLVCDWGYTDETKQYKVKANEFKAVNWKLAFDAAREYAEAELTKLETAIEKREKALIDADFYED